jgi:hypothetical protein
MKSILSHFHPSKSKPPISSPRSRPRANQWHRLTVLSGMRLTLSKRRWFIIGVPEANKGGQCRALPCDSHCYHRIMGENRPLFFRNAFRILNLECTASLLGCSGIASLRRDVLEGRLGPHRLSESLSRVDARPWFVCGSYLVYSPTHGYYGPRFILEFSAENKFSPALVRDFSGDTIHFFL